MVWSYTRRSRHLIIAFLISIAFMFSFLASNIRRIVLLEQQNIALKVSFQESQKMMQQKLNASKVSLGAASLEPQPKEPLPADTAQPTQLRKEILHAESVPPAQQEADTLPVEFLAPIPEILFETRVFTPTRDPFAFPTIHKEFTCPHVYLENVCYDVLEKHFVKHENDQTTGANIKFATIPHRIGSPEDINPATGKQKTITWMGDLTIYSQFMYKDKGAHFWLAIWPTIHYLDVVRRLFQKKHVILYTDVLVLTRPLYEQKLWEYLLLGLDIDSNTPKTVNPRFLDPKANYIVDPDSPRLSILTDSIPPGSTDYVCFPKMFITRWLPCKARMANYEEAHRFKQRLSYVLPGFKPMYHCSENSDNLFHVLQRKAKTRRFVNIDELQRAILQTAEVPRENVVVFDSDARNSIQSDVPLFSKITFLVMAHGAGAMNIIFMPKESHFVEIFPPFFAHERMYERLTKDLGMHYFPFLETDRSILDQYYPEYIGQPVPSMLAKKAPVNVTVNGRDQFKSVLRKAVMSYRKVCRRG